MREKWFKQKIFLFFHVIEESVIRFSVWCEENELHRKYKFFGGSMENATPPPILEKEQNWWSIGFSLTQSAQNYHFCSFIFQNKFYVTFWTLIKFFTKKKQLYEFIKKKSYHWIGYLGIMFDTPFIL